VPAPPLFSSMESFQPATVLEFVKGTSFQHPPVECSTHQPLLETLLTPSLLVGVTKPAFSCWLVYLVCVDACPSFSRPQGALPSLLCVFFNSLFIIQVFFSLWGRGQSVQGSILVYPRSGCGDTMCCLFAHLLVCVS
jgi:hypothetical protein